MKGTIKDASDETRGFGVDKGQTEDGMSHPRGTAVNVNEKLYDSRENEQKWEFGKGKDDGYITIFQTRGPENKKEKKYLTALKNKDGSDAKYKLTMQCQ